MTSQSYTLDSLYFDYDGSLTRLEYEEIAQNSNHHSVYIAIYSYKDYLSLSGEDDNEYTRRHYDAMLVAPETYKWDFRFMPEYKPNTYYSIVYNNNPDYEAWWYSQKQESTQGSEGTDVIEATSPTTSTEDSNHDSSILGIEPQAAITSIELDAPLVFDELELTQVLVGTNGSDNITGSDASEVLNGNQGKDNLVGGGGADAFLFETPGEFGKQKRDSIFDFDSNEGDKIVISTDSFNGVGKVKLKVVDGKKEAKDAASSNKTFIYDENKGMLYFNEDGENKGFGDGGVFAKLIGTPEIGASDFTLM